MTTHIVSDRNVTSVKAVVHGILGVVPVPFNLPNPNGCVDSNLTCPLQSGTEYTYVATLPVLEEYPRVSDIHTANIPKPRQGL